MQKVTGMDLVDNKVVATVSMLNICAVQNRGCQEACQKMKEATKTSFPDQS